MRPPGPGPGLGDRPRPARPNTPRQAHPLAARRARAQQTPPHAPAGARARPPIAASKSNALIPNPLKNLPESARAQFFRRAQTRPLSSGRAPPLAIRLRAAPPRRSPCPFRRALPCPLPCISPRPHKSLPPAARAARAPRRMPRRALRLKTAVLGPARAAAGPRAPLLFAFRRPLYLHSTRGPPPREAAPASTSAGAPRQASYNSAHAGRWRRPFVTINSIVPLGGLSCPGPRIRRRPLPAPCAAALALSRAPAGPPAGAARAPRPHLTRAAPLRPRPVHG
ncbi:MAG: hypothetical protein J3K34DRAFT_21285 [Monoraphidium minutum]|nr:MAG: hypothetical protein J3K34DRAFT_21285 [Monoraphidium minutum]